MQTVKPVYRIGAAGLDPRDWRLIEIVFKHSQYNRFEFVLAPGADPESMDILIANTNDAEGVRAVSAVRTGSRSIPVIAAVPRGSPGAARHAISIDRLTLQLLPILNRVVELELLRRQADSATVQTSGVTAPVSVGVSNRIPATGSAPSASSAPPASAAQAASAPVSTMSQAARQGHPVSTSEPLSVDAELPASTEANHPTGIDRAPLSVFRTREPNAPNGVTVVASEDLASTGNLPVPGSKSVLGNTSASGSTPVAGRSSEPDRMAGVAVPDSNSQLQSTTSQRRPAGATTEPPRPAEGTTAARRPADGTTGTPRQSDGTIASRPAELTPAATPKASSRPPPLKKLDLPTSPPHLKAVQNNSSSVSTGVPVEDADPAGLNSNLLTFPKTQLSPPAPQQLRVLVVDDSPTVRQQLTGALIRMGLACVVVSSAAEALKNLEDQYFDLILLDVVMPDMDGYKLTRLIKRNRSLRQIPIILLTSRSSAFDLARGALAGCDTYLVKPVTLQALETAVFSQLRSSLAIDDLSAMLRPPQVAEPNLVIVTSNAPATNTSAPRAAG